MLHRNIFPKLSTALQTDHVPGKVSGDTPHTTRAGSAARAGVPGRLAFLRKSLVLALFADAMVTICGHGVTL